MLEVGFVLVIQRPQLFHQLMQTQMLIIMEVLFVSVLMKRIMEELLAVEVFKSKLEQFTVFQKKEQQ